MHRYLSTVRDTFSHMFLSLAYTPYGICNTTGRYFSLPYRTGFQHVIARLVPYGILFPILSFHLPCTPYGISIPTGRDFSLKYRTGFQQASHVHISRHTVRLFTNHRTGLVMHIPYGLILPTTVSHIPENRTGLLLPPYGTVPFGRFEQHF